VSIDLSENLLSFAGWIRATRVSEILREQLWVVPTSQSIHIIAVSMVFVSGLILSIKLLRVGFHKRTLSSLVIRYTTLIYGGLLALLITGVIQTLAEPLRQLIAPVFWIKMSLIMLALLMTYMLSFKFSRANEQPGFTEARTAVSVIYAVLFISIWIAIIFCGRFIGYTYFYHL
tara:strand:+ start:13459 stop:13980 length:522 start_codon:yes stop_codon:yes gene_type:complete